MHRVGRRPMGVGDNLHALRLLDGRERLNQRFELLANLVRGRLVLALGDVADGGLRAAARLGDLCLGHAAALLKGGDEFRRFHARLQYRTGDIVGIGLPVVNIGKLV